MFKNPVAVSAFWMSILAHQPDRLKTLFEELLGLVSREGIRPMIGQIYPLIESGAIKGLESRSTADGGTMSRQLKKSGNYQRWL